MKIKISELNESDFLQLEYEYDPERENLNFEDQRFSTPVLLKGSARKESNYLFVEAILTTNIDRQCGRCLDFIPQPFQESLQLNIEVKDKEAVDITEDVRDMMILQHPMNFLIGEDKEGNCLECGKNFTRDFYKSTAQEKSKNVFSQLKGKF